MDKMMHSDWMSVSLLPQSLLCFLTGPMNKMVLEAMLNDVDYT